MASTEFAINDPLARKLWAADLGIEVPKAMYFGKFMSTGNSSMIKVRKEISKQNAGDQITIALRKKLKGDGIEGDNIIENTTAEEALEFFNDKVIIDQRRKGTKSKGKMSEQRVPYNIRKEGRDALAVWFAEDLDQEIMMYLSGARGVNADFHVATDWTGRASNSLVAPSAGSLLYGGDATSKADVAATDKVNRALIEKLAAIVSVKGASMNPFSVGGRNKFVFLMHEFQKFDLRSDMSDNDWADLHKNIDSKSSAIYDGSLGELAGLVLHSHENVIRFNDYGSGTDLPAARGLLLGASAGMVAFGGATSKGRYSWHEETDDRGNALSITAGSMHGVKKTRYADKSGTDDPDFSVIAVDTYYTPLIALDA